MILVTGAAGKTGRHILRGLRALQRPVRALVHSDAARQQLEKLGVEETALGDMLHPPTLAGAMEGVNAVLHIGPAMHPKESVIGINVIDAARQSGVKRFVYSSVAHPQIEALVNHQAKLSVERYLIESGLAYTILQPMHYMQNVSVPNVIGSGVLALPYSLDMPMSFLDLLDYGEVVVKVLAEDGHERATYHLCGPDHMSYRQVAELISRESGRSIEPRRISQEAAIENFPIVRSQGAYAALGVERLFLYYDLFGLSGNSNILRWLLRRDPTNYAQYVKRELAAARMGA
ncbi:SDR family oxidoreductase [Rhodoplanes roseus]|uniref:NmrA-like domain-containing protein n=1 Tax=Rhodoplanes roseus TaxID=29409 RepID=A0A327L9I0_9BRAD|nr:NmrA family NAD(P)-binding protein [Rhodoplanes roseus]RAI44368.1 hypothetical protein CH341_09440 [Rhodoplanes roseus]